MPQEQLSYIPEEEKTELNPELVKNTTKILEEFLEIKPEENVLLLTSNQAGDQRVYSLLRQALSKFNWRELAVDKKTNKKETANLLDNYQVIINPLTIDCPALYGLWDKIEQSKSRMIFMPNLDLEAFQEGGAMTENRQEMEQRLEKMEARLKNAVGLRIKTNYGTDLTIGLRPFKERRWFKDSGVINQPGHWDNLPGGEIFTVPDEEKVEGRLVLPVLTEYVSSDQGVDKFIYLNIRGGKITSIQGGQSAQKLRKYLKKYSQREKNPLNVYQCAEIAFGANSKARSYAKDTDQPYTLPATPAVEAEKRLGTIHIAFGSTKLGEEGVEGRIETDVHLDFIIPRHGLTVEVFDTDDDFKKNKNSRRVIDNGGWNFY